MSESKDKESDLKIKDLDNFNFSLQDILDNEKLVNKYVEEKKKNFNFQNFIFDSLPNCTTYKVDATSNLFENVTYDKIDGTYKYITNNLPFKCINDDYSYYMNFPLQALYFEEQFNKSKDFEEILIKENVIDNVINCINMPSEFNSNDNCDHLKINSSLKLNSKYNNQLENMNKSPIISNVKTEIENTSKASTSTSNQSNTITNNSINIYKIGSIKRVANPSNDNNSSKRFKPNTENNILNKNNNSNKNDSLNNITFKKVNSKPIVSILKKSKDVKPKKHVTFKPDGTINQYKLIYLDGRDLYSKNKDNKDNNKSSQDNISSSPTEFPNYHFSKLMEIPVLYTEALRSEEEIEERALQKKRKTERYYLDKEISFTPRETPAKKLKNKLINDPSINKYTIKIPQWGSKAFIRLINKTMKSAEYRNRIKQKPNYHPNLDELNHMDSILNSNNKIIELQKEIKNENIDIKIKKKHLKRQESLNNIFRTRIPKDTNPLEFLYEKLLKEGYLKKKKKISKKLWNDKK